MGWWGRLQIWRKDNPWYAAIVATGALGSGFLVAWQYFSSDPPVPVIAAFIGGIVSAKGLALVVGALLFAIGMVLLVGAPSVAAYHRRAYLAERRETDKLLKDVEDLQKEQKDLSGKLDDIRQQLNKVEFDRQVAINQVAEIRRDNALEKLQALKDMKWPDGRRPMVTIRAASHDDYDLVQHVKNVIVLNIGWNVELDGSNKPMLQKADEMCKLVFVTGGTMSFDIVRHLFFAGNLVGVGRRICKREWQESQAENVLVIEVLPD